MDDCEPRLYERVQMPLPRSRPSLVYVYGGDDDCTVTLVDQADLKALAPRECALLRALLTYTLNELDRSEATP